MYNNFQMKFKIHYLFVLFTFITACAVEEYDISDTTPLEVTQPETIIINDMVGRAIPTSANVGQQIGCVMVTYPFSVITSDSIKFIIENNSDFETILENEKITIVDFVYPLDITDNLGFTHSVPDLWSLATYFASCLPDSISVLENKYPAFLINFENSCYTYKYPLKVTNEENEDIYITNEDEFIIHSSEEELYFTFPFQVISSNGIDKNIASEFELEKALIECNGNDLDTLFTCLDCFEFIGCYRLVFPFHIKLVNHSESYEVKNPETMRQIFLQGIFEDFAYPLTLETPDSNYISVSDISELDSALQECFGGHDLLLLLSGTSLLVSPPCYDILFPLQVQQAEQILTFYDYNQLQPIVFDSLAFTYDVIYPVQVNFLKNNEHRELNSTNDVYSTLNECE